MNSTERPPAYDDDANLADGLPPGPLPPLIATSAYRPFQPRTPEEEAVHRARMEQQRRRLDTVNQQVREQNNPGLAETHKQHRVPLEASWTPPDLMAEPHTLPDQLIQLQIRVRELARALATLQERMGGVLRPGPGARTSRISARP